MRHEFKGFINGAPIIVDLFAKDRGDLVPYDSRYALMVSAETIVKIGNNLADLNLENIYLRRKELQLKKKVKQYRTAKKSKR